MAALARLLRAGKVPQSIPDDVGRQKLAVQYIHREIWEADEANLIDEEDMHVFGLQPTKDPLELVLCNACKKPIKASNYAAHAELCKALKYTEEGGELNNGRGHKKITKPPRKERKKSLTTCSRKSSGRDDILVTDDGSRISHGHIDCSDGAIQHPAKHIKTIKADEPQVTDHHSETTNGVAKRSCRTTVEAIISTDLGPDNQRSLNAGRGKAPDHVGDYRLPGRECVLLAKDAPVPLATKIYYSQRNNRLRSSLSRLYFAASNNEHCNELANASILRSNGDPIQNSAPNRQYPERIADRQDEMGEHYLHSEQLPDQIFAQCSEGSLGDPEGVPPAITNPTSFPVNNFLKHQTSNGSTRTNYISNSYHFPSNSGEPLRNLQQPERNISFVQDSQGKTFFGR